MNQKDQLYFRKMSKYAPKKENYTEEKRTLLGYLTLGIKYAALDALSEEVSPNIARKEISDRLKEIKELKGVKQK